MCPFCIATAAVIAGKVTGAGGLAAIAVRKIGGKSAVDNHPARTSSSTSRTKNSAQEIAPNANQRRNQDVSEHDRETANSVA